MTTGGRSRPVPDALRATSGVRHDLRHELATLRTLLDVAGGDPSLDTTEVRRLVATAQHEVGFAFDLLDALPIPSPRAPHRSETDPDRRPTATQDAQSDVAAVLRAAAAATQPRGHSIQVDAEGPLHVAMPRTALARVVRNLLGNALAASPRGGTVRLVARRDEAPGTSARVTGSHVRVEVHDDGPGPGARGFHREGGLGLEVVRSLVLPAGGWLVLGTSPDGGACAAVTLPAPAGAHP